MHYYAFKYSFAFPPPPFHPFRMTPEDLYARKLKEAAFAVKSGTRTRAQKGSGTCAEQQNGGSSDDWGSC